MAGDYIYWVKELYLNIVSGGYNEFNNIKKLSCSHGLPSSPSHDGKGLR